MTTSTDPSSIPALAHARAMALQRAELDRTITMLRSLDADQWRAPTDCPAWDVRTMYLHVLGACEAGASMRENVHQLRAARAHQRRHAGPLEASLSAVQVQERSALDPTAIVSRLAEVAPRTVRGRTRTPGLLRAASMQVDGPVVERWKLGYLIDTIYLRDLWMHRVDTCRAAGAELDLSADHDGVIVADVVAEWARRHGRPFSLTLTGPAGGVFAGTGTGAALDPAELDAVEFCRALAGRPDTPALPIDTIVPF